MIYDCGQLLTFDDYTIFFTNLAAAWSYFLLVSCLEDVFLGSFRWFPSWEDVFLGKFCWFSSWEDNFLVFFGCTSVYF